MILIVVGRRASLARPLGIAIAAALCVLGLENKVQAILLIGTLPLVILPFGSTAGASVAFWRNRRTSWLAALLAVALAIAAILAAWPLHRDRLRPQPARRRAVSSAAARPVRHLSGRAARPDRRLHDRLCRDLADQRGRDARVDVAMLVAGAAVALLAARSRLQHGQCDRRVQSAGEDADLCGCEHGERRERIEPCCRICCCCSRASLRCSRATASCCIPRRGRPCF